MTEKQFIDKFKPRIDDFCKKISNNKRHQPENLMSFSDSNYQNEVIISSMDQVNEFYSIIDDITFYPDFNWNFSNEHIEIKVVELLTRLLNDYTKDNVHIKKLYMDLNNGLNNEWFVVTQLNNIELKKTYPFKLIDSTIKLMSKKDFLTESTVIQLKPEEESETSFFNKFVEFNTQSWTEIPCIYTSVKAGDQFKAKELAINNFNISLNLLRLYFPHYHVTIKKPTITSFDILSYNKTKGHRNLSKKDKSPRTLVFDIKDYQDLEKKGIINLSDTSDISDVIKECLYWYGLALDTSFPSAVLLNYVTVLEHSLKDNNSHELSQRIADRCALFLGNDFENRKEICKTVKHIYDLRSKVVHSGNMLNKKPLKNGSEKELNKLKSNLELTSFAGDYAKYTLMKLINENSRLNGDFEQFIHELDDMKYKYISS